MSEMIPLSVPSIIGNEWKYIKECLDTEWVSSVGKYVDLFEKRMAEYTGARYAIACVNGTAALHISLIISGVKPGHEVIVPTLTFIAPINVVKYVGASPVFMDADEYYNMDSGKVMKFILEETVFKNGYTYNKKTDKKITAIIPVHVFGNAVWLDELYNLCKERNIKIIEDASESLGTKYTKGKFSGRHTGTIGDIGCFSFNGNKIITTGGGGMIVTDDANIADRAQYLTTQAKDDEVNYIHNEIGFNYRLTNIQAAMGVAQLEKITDFVALKKSNYRLYKQEIDNINGLHIADVPAYADNNHWMYCLIIDTISYPLDKAKLMSLLYKNNIQARPVWYLNHLQKPYNKYLAYRIGKAHLLVNNTLNLPCSASLTESMVCKVSECLKNV